MTLILTRRQVLRWGLVGGTAALLPGCGDSDAFTRFTPTPTPFPPTATPTASPTTAASFLTAEEQQVVRALTARIVPTDDRPGAVEAGAPAYIDQLLSNLPDEHSPGNVFAGGPFSDRNPFPDSTTGTPSTHFPSDNFAQFIPLTRLQLLSWRVQLLGSAAVPGADFNDAVTGPVVGLRDRYRNGIDAIQSTSHAMFNADFATLTAGQQDSVIAAADQDFVQLVTEHTLEGMFSAPEYGGNSDLVGWELIGYDGDSQPLGYSIFDDSTMSYNERVDKPNSTANPDEDFTGVDAITLQFLRILVRVVGGPHFP